MIIRRVDNGPLEFLHEKSKNEVWFICDNCQCGYRQGFSVYFNQSPGKLCYKCRRKEIASRKSVKEKQSKAAKKFHENAPQETKNKMILAAKEAQDKRWAKVPKEERNKNCLIPFQRYIDFFSNHPDFNLISTEETYLATKKVEYTCPNGHLNTERFSTTGSAKPPCKQCIGIDIGKIKEELEKLGHEFISLEKRTTQHTLTVKCDKGHIFSKTYGNWRADHSCKICSGNSFDLNEIIAEFAQVGYEVVNSNDFKGAIKRHEFTLRCHQGHVFNLSYLSFRNGKRCEECMNSRITYYEKFRKELLQEKYILKDAYNDFLIKDYTKERFNLSCPKGHDNSMFLSDWRNGKRCNFCKGDI